MWLSFNECELVSNFKQWLNVRWPLTKLSSYDIVNSSSNDFVHPLFLSHSSKFLLPIQNIPSLTEYTKEDYSSQLFQIWQSNWSWKPNWDVPGMMHSDALCKLKQIQF